MDPIRAALIASVLTLSGCYSTLVVHTRTHANHDRRFYVVVRQVPQEQFASEPYQKIAEVVFSAAPDDNVTRAVRQVAPGRVTKLRVRVRELLKPLDEQQPVAVYALVTEPGDAWKVLLTPPLLPRYDLDVDGDRLTVRASR
jgi:hypothetical protein